MEKEFETYEYLVKYNGSVENELNTGQQILIVQEENNHSIAENFDNKPIEYVGETTKEFEGVTCPMYNINQQPLYFQLNSSSELIPLSVNSIPSVETTNVFTNTYVLQNSPMGLIEAENGIPNKQSDLSFAPKLKDEYQTVDIDPEKLTGSYAEITLNDEQYEILKQKGWILLEMKDKVFSLDSSGLHEITNDHELITRLKNETSHILDKNIQPSGCSMKVVMIPETENVITKNEPKQEVSNQTETMEIISGMEIVHQDELIHQATQEPMVKSLPSIPVKIQENDDLKYESYDRVHKEKKSRKIHFKSHYLLKDIPKEIVLGKTVNGKNLIARVIEGKGFIKNTTKANKDVKCEIGKDRNINNKQFTKLVQQVLLGAANTPRMEDIASAETVMSQIFLVPELRTNLHKHKLIITKIIMWAVSKARVYGLLPELVHLVNYDSIETYRQTIREENEDGFIENQSEPSIVTGRFIINGCEGGFLHIPDMLQEHLKNSELEKYSQHCVNQSERTEATMTDDDMFLHVNITETKDVNNIYRVSVTVNKRYLSLWQVYNMKTKHINAVYACTACANVFKSHEKLEEHEQYKCSRVSELPAGNTQPYTVVKSNKTKVYMCNGCKATFVKLKECRDHLKIHNETEQNTGNDANLESAEGKKQTEVFKCKMCDNTYFHSSSLTKHILAKHIKAK